MNFPENIRCKNCKHFKRPYAYGKPDFDQVEAAKEFGTCRLAESEMGRSEPGTLAWADDPDNYAAHLNV